MLTVSPLKDVTKDEFIMLFSQYYEELGCGEDAEHLAEEYILPDLLSGLLSIDLINEDGVYAGFIIYQTDDAGADWCLKEGWGDVRELYILPALRRRGLGKFILYTAEMKLKESGVDKSYALPAEGSEEFFVNCGYKKTEEYNEDLEAFVYEKHGLNLHCDKV